MSLILLHLHVHVQAIVSAMDSEAPQLSIVHSAYDKNPFNSTDVNG